MRTHSAGSALVAILLFAPLASSVPSVASLPPVPFASTGALAAQEPGSVVASEPRVQGRSYTMEETGEEIPWALFVPSDYDPSRPWPLIVGLHGLGRPYDWLMGYEGMVDLAEERGYILATPKGYHERSWYGSRGPGVDVIGSGRDTAGLPSNLGELGERDVLNVLGLVREELNVDPDRIYLWGHSMGGAGTYWIGSRHPDLWAGLAVAAPAPRSSVDPREQLGPLRDVPVLVLQGDDDQLVPVERTRSWVAAMEELGMQHLYVEVPGGDHSAFVNADREMVARIFGFFDATHRGLRGP